MPTYQYRCTECATELEVVQRFTDDPLTECPECEGGLRKVYSAVGVVFKGSGFYATDNRGKGTAAAATSAEGTQPAETTAKAEPKAASSPAKPEGSASTASTSAA